MRKPSGVEDYLRRRGRAGPWQLSGERGRDFAGAVIVPALAEETTLFATLTDLAAQPPRLRDRFLVVVVVNHSVDADTGVRHENRRTLERLARFSELPLAMVDACTSGREFPPGEGVGLARKIGFDLSLQHLDWTQDPLLVSLDADTRVRSDYYHAIVAHFRLARAGAAILPFCHLRGETAAQEQAITLYELYLRSYALGLARAGSPYGFPTIGSAFACRADAYMRAGGMNRRCAGEDFYFLQQMVKTVGVASLVGTVVYPSPRPSLRTPFGTGRSIAGLLAGNTVPCLFHPVDSYRLLMGWLALAIAAWRQPEDQVLDRARALHPVLGDYLDATGFRSIWSRLQRQNHTDAAFTAAFHSWFDGLKTRQLLHRLACGPHPRQTAAAALPLLLEWAGLPAPTAPTDQLAVLRGCPGGCRPDRREIDVCLKECNVVRFAEQTAGDEGIEGSL